jgi:hypothetical protein
MDEHDKLLSILKLAVPASTPLTVAAEVQVLDLLGVVRNPQSRMAMKVAAALVPPDTPATLKGFLQLVGQLLHLSGNAKAEHHKTMADLVTQMEGLPDIALTFGTFLNLCQSLLTSAEKHRKAS